MHGMLRRCQDTGLKLDPEKFFVKQEKTRFYGVVCGQGRIQPDLNQMLALKQISAPNQWPSTADFLRSGKLHRSLYPKSKHTNGPTSRAPKKKTTSLSGAQSTQKSCIKIKDSISGEVTLTYKSREGDRLTSGRFAKRRGRSSLPR